LGHEDGFGDGRTALVEGGVGDVQAGELADEGLELEDDLERPLADLGLVGRIGADELAPRAQVVDDRRDEVLVGSAAEEGQKSRPGVLPADGLDRPNELDLRLGRRQIERRLSRTSSGMQQNRSSTEATPIRASISFLS